MIRFRVRSQARASWGALLAGALGAAVLAAGCGGGNDPHPPATTGAVHGVISMSAGGASVSGVQVVLQQVTPAAASRDLVTRGGAGFGLTGPDGRALAPAMPAGSRAPLFPAAGGTDTTFTGATGEFDFSHVTPGTYALYAQGEHSLQAVRTGIVVTAGATTQVGTVQLTPTGSISGTVSLEGESDHSGAVAFVAGTSYAAFSAADGSFTMSQVPVGTYTVIVTRPGWLSLERTGVVVTAAQTTALGSLPLGAGPSGGTVIFDGTVELAGGPAGPGVLVMACGLDPDGHVVGTIGSGFTGADGGFAIASVQHVVPSTSVALQAFTGEGNYVAFARQAHDLVVSPVTSGVYDVVSMIAGTDGGCSVSNYTTDEIGELEALSATALDLAGTPLDDAAAVRDQLLESLGREFAERSEGVFTTAPTQIAVTVDPPDVVTPLTTTYNELTDGGGELWDIDADGDVGDGTNDAYDGMFYLDVDGFVFPSIVDPSQGHFEDDRELVLGPQPVGESGLDVTRKIFVPATRSFARFAEVLTNTGGSDVTVAVRVSGNLGSDEDTNLMQYTSNGSMTVDPDDRWLVSNWDGEDPAVGFFFPGARPYKYADDLEYQWEEVTVPAGETVILFHWAFQRSDHLTAALAAELAGIDPLTPGEYFEGLTVDEAGSGLFAGQGANIVGGAGSVAPYATLQVENLDSGATATGAAAVDGSFRLVLRQTTSGDPVRITASDGLDVTVNVP